MDLNPFDDKLESARHQAYELEEKLKNIQKDLTWYESNTIDEHRANLEKIRTEVKERSHEFNQYKIKADTLENEIAELSKTIKSLWNPNNWFNTEQRELRAQTAKLKESHLRAKNDQLKAHAHMQDAEVRARDKNDEISRHEKFDFDKTDQKRIETEDKISQQNKQLELLTRRKQQVDLSLDPILKQIEKIEKKKIDANKSVKIAHGLDDQLTRAENSYERAMAHQSCEELFGIGSPRKVMSQKEAEIRRLNRDLEKLHKRGRSISQKAARDIRSLIIDGNNLCYEGSTFLGLDVLSVLVPLLAENYDTTVVFDASIRRALNRGDAHVRQKIGNSASIHVVATSTKADETIIDLAASDSTTFILSNDRFAEFGEKPAVAQQRIVRHEIVAGQVIIHDLGISETYRPPEHLSRT